jgi:benzylsuccinate CoA-transferase BbsF subunit
MPTPSRSQKPLGGLRVIALGASIPIRGAASWLADSGADVLKFRPDWKTPNANTAEAAFERQVSRSCLGADFANDEPYSILITDTASRVELVTQIPTQLIENAITIEVTSPLTVSADFDESLINDMLLWSRSGLGYLTREIDEDWQLAMPCLPLTRQASMLAGIAVATAAVAAVLDESDASDIERHIKIDQLELLSLVPMQPIAFAQLDDRIVGKAPPQGSVRFPGGTMPTANGFAFVRPVEPAHWVELLQLVGNLDWVAWMVEDDPSVLQQAGEEIDKRIRDWALTLTSEEISDLCQSEHVPVAPVYRPEEVVENAHHAARDFFRRTKPDTDLPSNATTGINIPILATVPPSSGEASSSKPVARDSNDATPVRPRATNASLPLKGLRILDLSWAWAGPFATTMLADLGAEVINVEWHPRVSNLRRNIPFAEDRQESNNTAAWWSANQRGKLSIGVDLKTAKGKSIIRDLAAVCDVVVENFSPGTVDRLGVGFDDLLPANPSLVYVSLSAFGQTGPNSHYIGYGMQVHAGAGACFATSQDGHTMSQMYIPFPDPVSGLGGAFAIAAYVWHARATGRPAKVDVSELEVVAAINIEPLLDALENDDVSARPSENRYLVVTTCDDEFVTLIARTPDDWVSFQHILDAPSHSPEDLRTTAGQLEAHALLALAETRNLIATLIQDSRHVLNDPYLAGFWEPDQSAEVAPTGVRIAGSVFHVNDKRAPIWRGAPALFGDTKVVLRDLLGYAPDDIDRLFSSGVIE